MGGGGIAFGQASSFGGFSAGGGAGMFSSGSGVGAPAGGAGAPSGDDPYANIQIDLNAVSAAAKQATQSKPFEKKTEEEKQADAAKRSAGMKSNLKTTKEDFDNAAKSKKEVRFGKSTTYQVARDEDDDGTFNNADLDKDGKGSPRPDKKIIDEVDLSDGRDEKEKAKQLLEKEQKEREEELKMMQDWKKKQEANQSGALLDKMKAYKGLVGDSQNIEESNNSSSISGQKKPEVEESYSDSFDESLSNSNSKRSNIWTEKLKSVSDEVKKGAIEDSLKSLNSNLSASASQSKDKSQKSSAIEESAENYEYDEDFESISKSKGEMMTFMANKPQEAKKLPTLKDQQAQKQNQLHNLQPSVVSQYARKENKQVMTDEGKYEFKTSTGETLREWSLKKELDEAELMIQDLKA